MRGMPTRWSALAAAPGQLPALHRGDNDDQDADTDAGVGRPEAGIVVRHAHTGHPATDDQAGHEHDRKMGIAVERLANAVGLVTLGFGVALTVAPRRSREVLGMGVALPARAVGVADLVIGSALLFGRPRWPWMASRAALNAVLAESYRSEASKPDRSPRAHSGALAMSALTVVDATLAIALAAQQRKH